jgi:hypothetical protein
MNELLEILAFVFVYILCGSITYGFLKFFGWKGGTDDPLELAALMWPLALLLGALFAVLFVVVKFGLFMGDGVASILDRVFNRKTGLPKARVVKE